MEKIMKKIFTVFCIFALMFVVSCKSTNQIQSTESDLYEAQDEKKTAAKLMRQRKMLS